MRCTTCGETKSDDEFTWRNRSKGVRASTCRTCKRAYGKVWHARQGQRRLDQIRVSNAETVRRNRERVNALKESTPCADCGVRYPAYVMDFDHLRDKVKTVSQLVGVPTSWSTIEAEIAKCEIVCANCHRERTHARRRSTCGGALHS